MKLAKTFFSNAVSLNSSET